MTTKEINEQELKNFAENIKLLREKSSLTQAQMAKLLNISIHSLKKLESGVVPKRLSVKVAFKIMSVFKINPFLKQ